MFPLPTTHTPPPLKNSPTPSSLNPSYRWECEVSFDELVKEMVEADIALVESGDMTS